jgi:hypothetical protein
MACDSFLCSCRASVGRLFLIASRIFILPLGSMLRLVAIAESKPSAKAPARTWIQKKVYLWHNFI